MKQSSLFITCVFLFLSCLCVHVNGYVSVRISGGGIRAALGGAYTLTKLMTEPHNWYKNNVFEVAGISGGTWAMVMAELSQHPETIKVKAEARIRSTSWGPAPTFFTTALGSKDGFYGEWKSHIQKDIMVAFGGHGYVENNKFESFPSDTESRVDYVFVVAPTAPVADLRTTVPTGWCSYHSINHKVYCIFKDEKGLRNDAVGKDASQEELADILVTSSSAASSRAVPLMNKVPRTTELMKSFVACEINALELTQIAVLDKRSKPVPKTLDMNENAVVPCFQADPLNEEDVLEAAEAGGKGDAKGSPKGDAKGDAKGSPKDDTEEINEEAKAVARDEIHNDADALDDYVRSTLKAKPTVNKVGILKTFKNLFSNSFRRKAGVVPTKDADLNAAEKEVEEAIEGTPDQAKDTAASDEVRDAVQDSIAANIALRSELQKIDRVIDAGLFINIPFFPLAQEPKVIVLDYTQYTSHHQTYGSVLTYFMEFNKQIKIFYTGNEHVNIEAEKITHFDVYRRGAHNDFVRVSSPAALPGPMQHVEVWKHYSVVVGYAAARTYYVLLFQGLHDLTLVNHLPVRQGTGPKVYSPADYEKYKDYFDYVDTYFESFMDIVKADVPADPKGTLPSSDINVDPYRFTVNGGGRKDTDK